MLESDAAPVPALEPELSVVDPVPPLVLSESDPDPLSELTEPTLMLVLVPVLDVSPPPDDELLFE